MTRVLAVATVFGLLTCAATGAAVSASVRGLPVAAAHAHVWQTLCTPWPSGSGLLFDGDFSSGVNPGTWHTYKLGQTLAPGWTVVGRSVDLYGNEVNRMPNGVCSVDLDGFHPGAIRSKAFATFPGATYTVTFLLSGNGGGLPAVKTMQVKAAGQSETLQYDVSNGHGAENGYNTPETWSFVATTRHTRMEFRSLDVNNGRTAWGPVVAAISVTKN